MRGVRSILLLLSLLLGVQTFHILRKPKSKNHQEITRMAILRATANVCKTLDPGFKKPEELDTKTLAKACNHKNYESNFEMGVKMICFHNVMIDIKHVSSEKHHFDSEKFEGGKELIIKGIDDISNHVSNGKFDDARKALGGILHTLQDFYSHSNWIELGNDKPYTALISRKTQLSNLAGDKKTCVENPSDHSSGAKLLESIIKEKILTSGYFGKNKPKGKCSHGGALDFTTGRGKSWDGTNKDFNESNHGSLHDKASSVAIDATVELLEKIQRKIKNDKFLRLVGLHEEKPKGSLKTKLSPFSLESRYKDIQGQPS
ncbi:von Willebrand factor A domain-containing protein 7-like [Myxocyprinus asiaticus]|uniref:von Willebrand factor A domain-containing protein 7-like n=1 Tax=Myxocyprinus asiaticus TaxID=70543 RepID=UPI0022238AB3|nr:von Willebrand factor A domain-containing protein 7-like [Myxocyprinus asiaticus]